tara:strand:- start:1348 stop:1533 length:186 start_codon:yes stop_codon:yes gene_type:complete
MSEDNNLHEIHHVGEMIKQAIGHDLLAEVVWSFGMACRNNKPFEVSEYAGSCEEALCEWDI